MTKEEAQQLKTFKNYCTCGGYAWQMNGRPEAQPHMAWCPQSEEYAEWYQALHDKGPNAQSHRTSRASGEGPVD